MTNMKKAMSRWLAFFLLIGMLLSVLSPLTFALDEVAMTSSTETDDALYEMLRPYSISYSCTYDESSSSVKLGGTVNHDTMITYRNATLEVYSILPNETLEDVLNREDTEPVASAALSVRFSFSIPVQYFRERYSRYALVLRDTEGVISLAGEPSYAGISIGEEEISPIDRSSFKGIGSKQVSMTGSLGVGSTIIPVDLGRMLPEVAHGYLQAVDQSYRYFDQAYVDELDAKIRSYAVTGTRVYLQFLLSPQSETVLAGVAEDGAYAMPNVFSEEVYRQIGACSQFLAHRYTESGIEIAGVIVGMKVDQKGTNDWGVLGFEEYVSAYAFYLSAIANVFRVYDPSVEIVVPFSSLNTYSSSEAAVPEGDVSPSDFLEALLALLEERYTVSFPITTMIESSLLPLEMTAVSKKEANESEAEDESPAPRYLPPDEAGEYSSYLQSLEERFSNAPSRYIYRWTPPVSLKGNELACAYAYSYYRLLLDERVSSFVVSFGDDPEGRLSSLAHILRYIDTADSFTVTKNLLPFFDAKSWSQVVDGLSGVDPAWRRVYQYNPDCFSSPEFKGSFSYFEFLDGNVSEWSLGPSVASIKSGYYAEGSRGLCAKIPNVAGEYAEIIYGYEYSENLAYTPYLSFQMALTNSQKSGNHLYEVRLILGNESATYLAEKILSANEITTVSLDLSDWIRDGQMLDYIKIVVRPLTQQEGEYSLWLFNVEGHSTDRSDEELTRLIEEERLRIRNETLSTDEEEKKSNPLWLVFGILLGVTALGATASIFFRKREGDEEDRASNDTE